MTSDLQRELDIMEIERLVYATGLREHAEAWQRIRARLTPDRARVAWYLFAASMGCGESKAARIIFEESKAAWLRKADAAIKAMEGGE